MILLNLGCGASRPGPPWVNVDTLYEYLGPGGQWARAGSPDAMESIRRLREESNYQNWDIRGHWPIGNGVADGSLMNHVLEHLDCQEALTVLRECWRVMRVGGVLRVGVPDPTVFRRNFPEDTLENTGRLFGEGERLGPDGTVRTFMDGALFFGEHKQVLGEDALWCHLASAGFSQIRRVAFGQTNMPPLASLDNRPKFTLIMEAVR